MFEAQGGRGICDHQELQRIPAGNTAGDSIGEGTTIQARKSFFVPGLGAGTCGDGFDFHSILGLLLSRLLARTHLCSLF